MMRSQSFACVNDPGRAEQKAGKYVNGEWLRLVLDKFTKASKQSDQVYAVLV